MASIATPVAIMNVPYPIVSTLKPTSRTITSKSQIKPAVVIDPAIPKQIVSTPATSTFFWK